MPDFLKWSYKLNSEYVRSLSPDVQRTKRNERRIINALIKSAVAKGFYIYSSNGDDCSPICRRKTLIESTLYDCDEGWLYVCEPSPTNPGKFRRVCSFYFIYGNGNDGCDVVSDGSWIENDERNTRDIYEAIDWEGSIISRQLDR